MFYKNQQTVDKLHSWVWLLPKWQARCIIALSQKKN